MQKLYFNALIASIGSGLEYFSFITFALQANYIRALFFPKDSVVQGMLTTFLIFGVGSFVTVVGGAFFGYLGDRIGRKKTFLYAILLMSGATLGIGILPGDLGRVGLSLLILLRLLQGISQGAELPGAITFVTEHSQGNQRGFFCGFMFLGVGLGAGLATSVNVLVSALLTPLLMLHFGWRIPFFAAALLGIPGFFLRKKAQETPVFMRMKKTTLPYRPLRMIQGFLLVFFGANLVSLGLYWPALFTTYYHFSASTVFLAMMLAFIFTAFLLPLTGYVGDRFGRDKVYLAGTFLTLMLLPFLFHLPMERNTTCLILFALLYYSLIVILAGNYPVMLTELFPPQTRYYSVALSYTGCYGLASFMPALAAFLFLKGYGLPILILFLMGAGILSLLAGIGYSKMKANHLLFG